MLMLGVSGLILSVVLGLIFIKTLKALFFLATLCASVRVINKAIDYHEKIPSN